MYCIQCGTQVEEGNIFCANCGARINPSQPNYSTEGYQQSNYAPNYGYQQPQNIVYGQGAHKSKIAAGLLALFLGYLGLHNFYLHKIGRGVAQLMFSLAGFALLIIFIAIGSSGNWALFALFVIVTCIGLSISGLWSFIEMILIFCGSIKRDGRGIPLI